MSAEGKKPRYMLVFGGLAALTAIEVAVAFMGFERRVTVMILIGLAVWKALLVAMYFMHLKWETRALKILAAVPFLPAAIMIIVVLMEKF
ncbi:MAG: cytochrome C oxidase subunit IV family protein [Gemmatimonadota bacterium]|nr:cytochrome C oxidase subunit IV family protein [Gemmatimonadota bacterium]